MDQTQLQTALAGYFGSGGQAFNEGKAVVGANFEREGQRWVVALCADQPEEMDYLKAFERGMQILLEQSRRAQHEGERLAVALAITSTKGGGKRSYRRALKKYSNSIVFEDVGISLIFVRDDGNVEIAPPDEVNTVLRRLP